MVGAAASGNEDRSARTAPSAHRPTRHRAARLRRDPLSPDAIYERNVDAIYSYLSRRLGPDQGEELTAQVFLESFSSAARFDPARGTERAWLFGITLNVLRKHHRQEARRRRAVARLEGRERTVDLVEETAVDRVWAQDSRSELRAALADLSAGEREVLLLHAWTDLTYADIAAVLGLPVGTVRSRLSRARSRLAAVLGPVPLEDVRGTA